jgi:hypothetical protein
MSKITILKGTISSKILRLIYFDAKKVQMALIV